MHDRALLRWCVIGDLNTSDTMPPLLAEVACNIYFLAAPSFLAPAQAVPTFAS